ncbi:DUF1549 and DUF1553 domain-containing protein [Rubripirellula sp.]|nr:DUF1549 and DUF1553 domain-containing protein [Rubripirellula sp.]
MNETKFAVFLLTAIFFGVAGEVNSMDTPPPGKSTETNRDEAIDFKNDLIPIFTKLGCNAGKCHGSAIGRGGFRLSLYGGTPEADYDEIVRKLGGRRVNLVDPASSLIFLKPAEVVEHGGGAVLVDDDSNADTLMKWIEQGAKFVENRKLVRVEVAPKRFIASGVADETPLKVVAHYDDGITRDVTHLTKFVAEDAAAIRIGSNPITAQGMRAGRHIIIARYSTEVVPIELIVPNFDPVSKLVSEPRPNFVDDEVLASLNDLRLPVSPVIADQAFKRRVSLDLMGRLPAYQRMSDSSRLDREAVIDGILASEEFVEFYTLKFSKLLRIQSKGDKNTVPTEPQAARGFHDWLAEQLRNRVGYDQIAREIITASGDTTQYGPATFYTAVEDARLQTEFATEVFMGSRMKCANCHNHPLDQWTQDDFHGLAAIFAKLTRSKVIRLNPVGKNIHPATGKAALMKIPGGNFLPSDTKDGRGALAEWLTDRKNPYFAKAIVNRLWKSLMGRGLVEPVDDFRATNPATHPVLLNRLAEDFVEHGYDIRHTLKVIAMSSSYSRSSIPVKGNESDNRFYSHMVQKPLEPEVLADAISDVLGVSTRYGDESLGTRAIALRDGAIQSDSLDVLGRCDRTNSCEGAPAPIGPLAQKLHLFNGDLLNERIGATDGRLQKLIQAQKTPTEIVNVFYESALNRQPNDNEIDALTRWIDLAKPAAQQRAALEDFVWSIVTCKEFVTNH